LPLVVTDVKSLFWTGPARAEPAPSRATAVEVRMMQLIRVNWVGSSLGDRRRGFVDEVVKSGNPKRVRKLKMPQVTITKMVAKAKVRTTRERVTVVLYQEGAGG
jgi:hypothetical protein